MGNSAWFTNGGAYLLVGVGWLLAAISGYVAGALVAKRLEIPNDGCLQGASNVVLALLGGGIGLFVGRYPWFVGSSLLGAFGLPALATWVFYRRNRR